MSPYAKKEEEVYEGCTLAETNITGLFFNLHRRVGTYEVFPWERGRFPS